MSIGPVGLDCRTVTGATIKADGLPTAGTIRTTSRTTSRTTKPYHEGDPRMASAVPTPPAMDRPHFSGIGGAGMSGIAKILAQRGARVSGSDARESGTAAALRRLGATVHI